jgi:glycosyltransferase involved in cell wall biosynthesis
MVEMTANRKLRIALECRVEDPRSGVGSAILTLAHALSRSTIQDQEYTFIVNAATKEWLEPFIFGPCRLVAKEKPKASTLKNIFGNIAPLRTLWRGLRASFFPIAKSDGYVESEHFDLVHFVTPVAYRTTCPTIYQPHDLQHRHYPQFFTKTEYVRRERTYRAFCNQAMRVCVQTEWTRQDLIKQYGIAAEKIVTIPWGSVFDSYQSPSKQAMKNTLDKYRLPEQFFFYPAVTWAHKNHEVIIRALHFLKHGTGRTVQVYFTGQSTEHRTRLDQIAAKLGVSDQLHYLGFLSPEELQAIFGAATAMIFPSKFEGFGLPILEAFHAHLPVIASRASVLPEVAQDGALYFDPDDPAELATLMTKILEEPRTREDLIRKADRVLERSSIKDTAVSFQVLYEQTAANGQDHNRKLAMV